MVLPAGITIPIAPNRPFISPYFVGKRRRLANGRQRPRNLVIPETGSRRFGMVMPVGNPTTMPTVIAAVLIGQFRAADRTVGHPKQSLKTNRRKKTNLKVVK